MGRIIKCGTNSILLGYVDDDGNVYRGDYGGDCIGYISNNSVYYESLSMGFNREFRGRISGTFAINTNGYSAGELRNGLLYCGNTLVAECPDGDNRVVAAVLLGLFDGSSGRSCGVSAAKTEAPKTDVPKATAPRAETPRERISEVEVSRASNYKNTTRTGDSNTGGSSGDEGGFFAVMVIGVIVCLICRFFTIIFNPFIHNTVNPFIYGVQSFLMGERPIVSFICNYLLGAIIAVIIMIISHKGGAGKVLSVIVGVIVGLLFGLLFGIAGGNTADLIGGDTFLDDLAKRFDSYLLGGLVGIALLYSPIILSALTLRLGAIKKEELRKQYLKTYSIIAAIAIFLFAFFGVFIDAEITTPFASTLIIIASTLPSFFIGRLILKIKCR